MPTKFGGIRSMSFRAISQKPKNPVTFDPDDITSMGGHIQHGGSTY